MIRSSITLSLIFRLPLWTMKTSCSRIEVSILTDVSPLLNFLRSALAGEVPNRSQMASTRRGCDEPEKILTRRMMKLRTVRQSYEICRTLGNQWKELDHKRWCSDIGLAGLGTVVSNSLAAALVSILHTRPPPIQVFVTITTSELKQFPCGLWNYHASNPEVLWHL